jgi:hypothetical protein
MVSRGLRYKSRLTLQRSEDMAPVGCHFTIALVWMRGHQQFEDLAGCRVQFTAPSADPCQRSRSRD